MIISYVRIINYYNIVNQEFCFDPEHCIILRNNDTINVEDLPFSSMFFRKNILVSAIIGENGAGKSTLLNALGEILSGQAGFEYILIIRDQNDLFLKSNVPHLKIKSSRNFTVKILDIDDFEIFPLSTILYSNVKTRSTWYLNEKVSLLTETYLSTCSKYDCDYHYGEEISEIDAHELNDITRQISYFSNEDTSSLGISIPDTLDFGVSDAYRKIIEGETHSEFTQCFDIENVIHQYRILSDEEKHIGIYEASIILSFLHEIFMFQRYSQYAELSNDFIKRVNFVLNSNIKAKTYFDSVLAQFSDREKLLVLFGGISYYDNKEIEKISISFNKKKEILSFLSNQISKESIPINDSERLKKFVKMYSESIYRFQYLTLKWAGLSSGESAKLNIYSRIYERIHNKLRTLSNDYIPQKNLIILIDEGATFFHPEWQRTFIYDIIRFFEDIIIKTSKVEHVHIVLTSHSPFVISDLTRNQIIYLKKEKLGGSNFNFCKVVKFSDKPLSFAGNISSLYRNSFFLDKLLIGEYASNMLDQLMDDLSADKPDLDMNQIDILINEISEPILRNHFLKLSAEYRKRND